MSDAVVFLDLDNVCNDNAFIAAALAGHTAIVSWSMDLARTTLDPVRVARVQRVCDAARASVTIVSGWRRFAPVEDIAACLRSAGLTAPVLGAVGGVKMSADLRAEATRQWLAEHPEVTRWCVLDDARHAWMGRRSSGYSERATDGRRVFVSEESEYVPAWFAGRLVVPVDGITDDDAARALAILGGDLVGLR